MAHAGRGGRLADMPSSFLRCRPWHLKRLPEEQSLLMPRLTHQTSARARRSQPAATGRLVRRITRGGSSKGELRRRAHAKADEPIALSGRSGAWKGSSSMSDYITREAIPGVETADDSVLRPRTKKSYLRVLSLVADALKGFRIVDAVRPRTLEEALASIALSSGTATARQCAKTMSKYVEPLVRDEVITHNPLKSFKPRLPEHRGTSKAVGGQALATDERERAIGYLLSIDPNDVEPPKRGRYTVKDRRSLRRSVVEITLLQAVTGLRINEARLLTLSDMGEEGGVLSVTVKAEVSVYVSA